jgi:hypothetical protein
MIYTSTARTAVVRLLAFACLCGAAYLLGGTLGLAYLEAIS